jgi:hypothetical protein
MPVIRPNPQPDPISTDPPADAPTSVSIPLDPDTAANLATTYAAEVQALADLEAAQFAQVAAAKGVEALSYTDGSGWAADALAARNAALTAAPERAQVYAVSVATVGVNALQAQVTAGTATQAQLNAAQNGLQRTQGTAVPAPDLTPPTDEKATQTALDDANTALADAQTACASAQADQAAAWDAAKDSLSIPAGTYNVAHDLANGALVVSVSAAGVPISQDLIDASNGGAAVVAQPPVFGKA